VAHSGERITDAVGGVQCNRQSIRILSFSDKAWCG
jgi:hypothetical protein